MVVGGQVGSGKDRGVMSRRSNGMDPHEPAPPTSFETSPSRHSCAAEAYLQKKNNFFLTQRKPVGLPPS